MAQQGEEKQVPVDQRGRGKNLEHPEGQANIRNDAMQKAETPPPPVTKKPAWQQAPEAEGPPIASVAPPLQQVFGTRLDMPHLWQYRQAIPCCSTTASASGADFDVNSHRS